MAQVRISPQKVTRQGLAAAYTAAPTLTTGDTFLVANDGRTMLHLDNSGVSGPAVTVTVDTPGQVDGLAVPQRTPRYMCNACVLHSTCTGHIFAVQQPDYAPWSYAADGSMGCLSGARRSSRR